MKTALLPNNTFLEFTSMDEFNDLTDEDKVLGYLRHDDSIQITEVHNSERYLITLINNDGTHEYIVFNDGFTLKANYDSLDKSLDRMILIFNFEDIRENLADVL